MEIGDFDYELPTELIAQAPLEDRAASRLLWLRRDTGTITHHTFRELPSLLQTGDLLVLNDTRVSAKRLRGVRPEGGRVEVLLLRELVPGVYEAITKPAKRLRLGARIQFGEGAVATVRDVLADGRRILAFDRPEKLTAVLEAIGETPLPPYIHHPIADPDLYQTVYARVPGSAAAPTAGLHFTESVLADLRGRGIDLAFVTLNVGEDTFRPVRARTLEGHKMHGETLAVPPETAEAVRNAPGRIVAVGTTSVRALEASATGRRTVEPGQRVTDLFIRPGYQFQVVDGILTNFHLPRTTMLVMISAFAPRERVLAAYREAVLRRYRFLSFGDCMLIL
jgi:S-adenosylmethionine:tRNA ribosyltransferase-isomerase